MTELRDALQANFGYGLTGAAAERVTREVACSLAQQGIEVTEAIVKTIYDEIASGAGIPADKRERYREIKRLIEETCPKYGNDIYEADMFARAVANSYTKEVEKYKNPRGGIFQAGLYPVSANVPLGGQTGATPDGRLALPRLRTVSALLRAGT